MQRKLTHLYETFFVKLLLLNDNIACNWVQLNISPNPNPRVDIGAGVTISFGLQAGFVEVAAKLVQVQIHSWVHGTSPQCARGMNKFSSRFPAWALGFSQDCTSFHFNISYFPSIFLPIFPFLITCTLHSSFLFNSHMASFETNASGKWTNWATIQITPVLSAGIYF